MSVYTGIGSRKTPGNIIGQMIHLGRLFAQAGYTLRSGGASGADLAFEEGAYHGGGRAEIYHPWYGFSDTGWFDPIPLDYIDADIVAKATKIAADHHPYWDNLKIGARKLHTRNVFQVLGIDLESPTKLVICYTPGGALNGGTAQAMRIAEYNNIKIHNLYYKGVYERLITHISAKLPR